MTLLTRPRPVERITVAAPKTPSGEIGIFPTARFWQTADTSVRSPLHVKVGGTLAAVAL